MKKTTTKNTHKKTIKQTNKKHLIWSLTLSPPAVKTQSLSQRQAL
jgi:hypothetical protein